MAGPAQSNKQGPNGERGHLLAAPSVTLPKGGGAIRGIGEKFAANPVTGTGSMSVPIATSPGRSGFGPQLSLSYDSGAGNGPFGFGWSLSLPSVTRKTDKGLPQYDDAGESDVFILSGVEDLVPLLRPDRTRYRDDDTIAGYIIHRYRPRIEGLFARIERWTRKADGDVHWRSISKDNILSLYGKDAESRIADPEDSKRVFSWLICETRDDKGNAVLYNYKPEDGAGVDLTRAHEHNRGGRNDPRRTANRYLKRIRYGGRVPLLDDTGKRPLLLTGEEIQDADWMFEVVFDYGEHDAAAPKPDDAGPWTCRNDPFSFYRAGFEIRTLRLCQRVLMFHHFDGEEGVGNDCLVRSTDLTYSHEQDPANARNPVYTFLLSVAQCGYKRHNGGYLRRSLPPVEYEYTQPVVQDTVHEVEAASLENLPVGLDGAAYQWTDLHGEGIPGILSEQASAWFYKRNLSPIGERPVEFAPLERVAAKPNLALAGGQAQFMDLAGDGQPDLVVLEGPVQGLYEHDGGEGWQPFRPFTARLNRDLADANLKLIDLDGDGHADVLISENDAFVWHPARAEEGFGPARLVPQALDEEKGARLVFAEGTQSIYLADMSGDGLTDLVRIRCGDVCYWPNLGYGRFGAKVTMDHAPHFDHPDQFDHKRIRLADIDGTGTTDIVYLHRDGVRLYFNQSGNGWSEPQFLRVFPRVDDLVSIVPADLLGNGTASLIWSAPFAGDARRPMRYVNLMGGQKPHLLVRAINNLGAETRVTYAPSTKFYLQDEYAGKPWLTRLPFPVHVVERVETCDHISRNRFVSRYAYHHGYFDGIEREFRGFGMVEQRDTEEYAALTSDGTIPEATNVDAASHVPPVLTKTWFHTGLYLSRDHVSDFFAGLLDAPKGEYYREPGLTNDEARVSLLPDTVLPTGLTREEEREACRALKGAMLRQEIYALDGTDKEKHPYAVTEQSFTISRVQPRAENRQAVFFTHTREVINYHYERRLVPVLNGHIVDGATAAANSNTQWKTDSRIQHGLTLEVDPHGNVLKEVTIGYGRRHSDASLPLQADRDKQTKPLITYTENRVTNPIDDVAAHPGDHRTPLPCETCTYELTGYTPGHAAGRYQSDDFVQPDPNHPARLVHTFDSETPYEGAPTSGRQRRLIEHARTLYRPDDLGAAQNDPLALLSLGRLERLALPGEAYRLAFTPGLLAQVFQRDGQSLLPDPADVLGGQGGHRGGYLSSQQLTADGRFPITDPDDHWWIPTGRVFLSPNHSDTAAQELVRARRHFFLPHRYRDPFAAESVLTYDVPHDLLIVETRDPVGNRVTVGERLPNGDIDPAKAGNDYRVLQPRLVTDPNRNRTLVAFDTLGMVVATAVKGKDDTVGDTLENGFESDPTQDEVDGFYDVEDPHVAAPGLLKGATTRIIYDLDRFRRTQHAHPKDPTKWLPVYAATLARETHVSDQLPTQGLKIQIGFSYSDGFGREIQKKIQAEPGPLVEGGPVINPRWVGSGWTIFNNKGKPVRQYEPFFSRLERADGTFFSDHRFEFGAKVGVSPILFYDPIERVVATLHPNHTWEKVVFDPWRQETWDVNDTVLVADPKTDADVGDFFSRLADADYMPTWHAQRHGGAMHAQEQAAATKAAAHADTPTGAYFDTLGRPFLTVAHNKVVCPNHALDGTETKFHTRVELDIEGNQCTVRDAVVQNGDAQGRIVMRYAYDMLGNRIHEASMEAGRRWTLNDVAGKPVRTWDSRGHILRTEYDLLRRPLRSFVTGADPGNPDQELLTERLVYGEQHLEDALRNLRGRLYLHLDQAGVVTNEGHDFKGNPLQGSRRLAREYKRAINWSAIDAVLPVNATAKLDPTALEVAVVSLLEAGRFVSRTSYDALNRPVQLITPRSDQPGARCNVIQPVYNEANLLERVDVWLDRLTEPAGLFDAATVPSSPVGVNNIEYNAKGQRLRIDYKNGATTRYAYDPETFRLIHLYTRRGATFTEDCENPHPPPTTIAAPDIPSPDTSCGLQNLHYTYDPAGNITHVRDDAQQTIYFRNKRVEPSADYTYDALYRLIEATGREHLGQVGGAPIPHSYNDTPRVGVLHPGDGMVMGTYTERYVYDAVGNFLEMKHSRTDAQVSGWTRGYSYDETSLIEDGTGGAPLKTSNRLTSTTIGTTTETYSAGGNGYDAHGNMLRMPQLQVMQWNCADQLQMTRRQAVNDDDEDGLQHQGERTWYVYDAGGQRVRKVTERQAAAGQMPTRMKERVYLGGCEIYRQYENDGHTVTLERETLHIMDEKQRIALVETKTLDVTLPLTTYASLIRYHLGNHLGSASLELDQQAQIISYEEYTPYGSTAYQAVRSGLEASPKRYRYTGMERDEESGLNYHGARYYAPWLGRWASTDPIGIGDGISLFLYTRSNPINGIDVNGKDTDKWAVERTDNFFELFRESFEEVMGKSITEERLKELFPEYKSRLGSNPKLQKTFQSRMEQFGRYTVKLKDFNPPGFEHSGDNPAACYSLACLGAKLTEEEAKRSGVTLYETEGITPGESDYARRIKTDKTASELALSQIKRHIDSGRPVVSGVNEPDAVPGSNPEINIRTQPVTEHFVDIFGYETDIHDNFTGLFAKDNAPSKATEIRFVVGLDRSITKPSEKRPKAEEYVQQEYQLSELRFHPLLPYTGDLLPVDDYGRIMYWPNKGWLGGRGFEW
jgi:RHS repeat-associated protein